MLMANIWYVHYFPLRKPACSWRSLTTITPSNMFSKTLQNILHGTDSNIIPLQLSQCWSSPFFCSFTIRALFLSLGITSIVHIFLMGSVKTSEKCSTHLLAWVSSVVSGFPSLSVTLFTLALACQQSCLVCL